MHFRDAKQKVINFKFISPDILCIQNVKEQNIWKNNQYVTSTNKRKLSSYLF